MTESSYTVTENSYPRRGRTKRDGEQFIEINYEEAYNLVGRLLTLNDASNSDPVRRAAQKTLIKQTVYGWVDDVARDQGMPEWGNFADTGPGVTAEQKQKDETAVAAA